MRALRRLALTGLLGIVGAIGIGIPGATASRVTLAPGLLTVDGQGDPVNNIQVGLAPDHPNDYRIIDRASNIADPLPPSCLREVLSSVRCPAAPLGSIEASIEVYMSFGGDNFTVLEPGGIPTVVRLKVDGNAGDDNIVGRTAAGREAFFGFAGDDTLTVRRPAANKVLDGGPGNDTLIIGLTVTTSRFLASTESALAAASTPGGEALGGADNDKLTGGPENDKLSGGPGKDKLKGGKGKDKLTCGGGRDSAVGGAGKDSAKGCEKEKGVE